jgi:hypothetical protein
MSNSKSTATVRWFSPGTPASATNKTEILLKVASNYINVKLYSDVPYYLSLFTCGVTYYLSLFTCGLTYYLFDATFNNISVLLVAEAWVPWENHRTVAIDFEFDIGS